MLDGLLDEIMTAELRASPELATTLGLDVGPLAGSKRRLDDRSFAGVADSRRRVGDQLRRLEAFDERSVSGLDLVNLQSVRETLRSQDVIARSFDYGAPTSPEPYVVSHLTGAYAAVPDLLDTRHGIRTDDDAEAFLERIQQFAGELAHETDRVRSDAARGAGPPDFVLDRTLQQLKDLRAADARESPLVRTLQRKTKAAGLHGAYVSRAEQTVRQFVNPALDAQISVVSALRPRAASAAGVWRLPDGESYYSAALRASTTSDLAPEALHEMGRALVERLGATVDELLAKEGYGHGPRAQRVAALQADARYVYPNDAAGRTKLLADIRAKLDEITRRLPRDFHRLPKTKVEVRPVPAFLQAGAPFAQYEDPSIDGSRPGIYYVNLRDTAETPSWLLTTTTFHEALPGHHLQQVVLQEGRPIPLIRKVQWSSGYGEGWGLYAEQLADELGMYDHDPAGRIGYVLSALLRAVRLVGDTGVHVKRWSREEAIAWICENGGFGEGLATNEVERYCVWPGQACSYMVGLVTWNRLRDQARARLGARFDVRDFHDAGLAVGAVPLTVLSNVMEGYVAAFHGG